MKLVRWCGRFQVNYQQHLYCCMEVAHSYIWKISRNVFRLQSLWDVSNIDEHNHKFKYEWVVVRLSDHSHTWSYVYNRNTNFALSVEWVVYFVSGRYERRLSYKLENSWQFCYCRKFLNWELCTTREVHKTWLKVSKTRLLHVSLVTLQRNK